MNKLFKAGLAVFAIALLATSASAFSPAWDTIPDVLVGGCEGGGIVFTDAIDAFDYVSDEDNATTSLGIYFAEGAWNTLALRPAQVTDGVATTEVTINAKGEVDYSGTGDTSLDNQALLSPALALTTPTNGGLTITASDGADRAVVLIASDGFTSPAVSKVFRVRGSATECDDASLPVVAVNVDGWDLQSEFNADWAFATFGVSGTAATSGQTGDALVINAPLVGQNVSFWQLSGAATKIPLATASSGNVLRARFTVTGGAATAAQWPGVRMRVFENANHNPCNLIVSSNGYVPAPSASQTYQLFYEAPASLSDDLNVAFFAIDLSDTQGGAFSLQQVDIDSIVGLNALFSQVAVVDSGESLTFSSVIELGIATTVTGSATADAFTFTASAISSGQEAFEIGQLNNVVASMAANTLYRMVCTVTSTTPVASQPSWGFRLFPANNAISNVNRFVGTGSGSDVLATSTPKTYSTYLTSEGINGLELRAAFDMIHNVTTRSGNATWDRAVIESVDLGLIP